MFSKTKFFSPKINSFLIINYKNKDLKLFYIKHNNYLYINAIDLFKKINKDFPANATSKIPIHLRFEHMTPMVIKFDGREYFHIFLVLHIIKSHSILLYYHIFLYYQKNLFLLIGLRKEELIHKKIIFMCLKRKFMWVKDGKGKNHCIIYKLYNNDWYFEINHLYNFVLRKPNTFAYWKVDKVEIIEEFEFITKEKMLFFIDPYYFASTCITLQIVLYYDIVLYYNILKFYEINILKLKNLQ